ncbi:MAG: hypothetical protein MUC96_15095 [Myxococcaceae bacterium]|nr:hypothetical protein [Myxococcaceae bacterium]
MTLLTAFATGCGGTDSIDPYEPKGCVAIEERANCTVTLPENGDSSGSKWKAIADAICTSTCTRVDQLYIHDAQGLGSLRQLKLELIRSARFLQVSSSRQLRDLDGLQNLGEVDELRIFGNHPEFTLRGFAVKRSLGSDNLFGGVRVSDLSAESLAPLDSLEEVSTLVIRNIGGLKVLSGFDNLRVGRRVSIEDNPDLEEVTGFNSIERLTSPDSTAGLDVGPNPKLVSLGGFATLKHSDSIRIGSNPMLDECKVRQKFRNVLTFDFQLGDNGPCR